MRNNISSLRTRLVALVAVIFAAFAALFVGLYTSRMHDQAVRSLEGRAQSVARVLAVTSEAAVDFADPVNGAQGLQSLGSAPDAVWAELRASGDATMAWWGRSAPSPIFTRIPEGISFADGLLYVKVPVNARVARPGSLVLAFSLTEVERNRALAVRFAWAVAGLLLLTGLGAAFALGTFLVQPLQRVTAVALRIAEGDAAARDELDTHRRDEVGTLSAVLAQMVARLQDQTATAELQRESVRALNRDLEHRVSARTRELASTNAELAERLGELHAAQEQLITADRRNSVGVLAAGVAHEINNPIAYVGANVRHVADVLRGVEPGEGEAALLQLLDEAAQGCDRVSYIVKSLKIFSHGGEEKVELVDVGKAVETAVSMASNELRHRAALICDLQPVPPVRGSVVRVAQVVLNLLINAGQAIGEGDAESNQVRVGLGLDAQGKIRLRVSDTGAGMTPEVRARLFTPFFTTKPIGIGTGLGLSICQGIVTSFGGTIEVESELGKGSTFTVVLPPATELAASDELPKTRGHARAPASTNTRREPS